MNRAKIPEKAQNAVVPIKGAAAFFICGTKNKGTDNLLSNSRNFYPGLGKKLNTIAVLRKSVVMLFFTKGAAPDNGAAPFSRSTKNKRFLRKKVSIFCYRSILSRTFRLQRRDLGHHIGSMY